MPSKRFHSRRSYSRIIVGGSVCSLLLVMGLLSMDLTGSMIMIVVAAVAVVLGLVWLRVQGNKDIIEYVLGNDALLLRRGEEEERLLWENVIDANLIDLVSARDYVQKHGNVDGEMQEGDAGATLRTSTRYCAVPLRIGRLDSFLRGLTDLSASGFRLTLVLLRIRDGGVLLLSPKYSERMVLAIEKAKGSIRE